MEEKKIKDNAKVSKWRRRVGLVLNGKFFPRKFFVKHWSIILTMSVLFLASIAHRNMYMVQINKIKKLDVELVNRRTDRILLEQRKDGNMQLMEIDEAVERYNLPLIHSPEPKGEIVVKH